jgi:hypothetical protein
MRAKSLRERGIFLPASHGRDAISEFICELNAQVAKSPNALDGHKIAWNSAAVAQRIKCRDAGAKQRSGFGRFEGVRNARNGFDWREHVLLEAAIEVESGNRAIFAIREIACAACGASVVLTAVPADADAIPFFPGCDSRTDFVDHTCNFVAWDAGKLEARPQAVLDVVIAEADAASLHLDAHLAVTRRWNFPLDDFEISARLWNLRNFHLCHLCFASPEVDARPPIRCSRKGGWLYEFPLALLSQERQSGIPLTVGAGRLAAFGTRLRRLGLRADGKDSYTGHPVL